MSNFKLPTSGDRNWGSTLNAYLANLDNKMKSLETQYATLKDNSAIKNIGYASSGIVGEAKIDFKDNEISFFGDIFISGDVNTYFTIEEDKKVFYPVSGMSRGQSEFIFLKYISDDSFEILTTQENFQANYTTILIGMIYKNQTDQYKFVPYYHSSLKTLMQVQYELISRWVDLEKYNSYFTITINNKKVPDSISCGTYDLICGGLGLNSISKFYTVDLEKQKVTLESKEDFITLVDSAVEDKDKNIYISTSKASFTVNSKGNYYRILLDVFGNIILQKAYSDFELQGDGVWREQQVLNTRFGNEMPSGLNANLIVEVARFGYNGNEIQEGTYCQDPQATDDSLNVYQNMTFVKSIINGVSAQQSPRVWVTRDSQIELDKTTFKNSATSNVGFKINYQSADGISEIVIDKDKDSSNELLFTRSKKDVQVGTLDVAESGGITFSSDRRRKENFSNVSDSYLKVVEDVPVMNYNYKNSIIPQVGIMAQDLENTNISNINCFVKVEDSLELNNKRSLYETKLVYILWKALQEESELRKKLEQRVADLEAN